MDRTVIAPEVLGLDTRDDFRRDALRELEPLQSAHDRLVVDLHATRSMDSAGLGALLHVQRVAQDRRVPVVLREPTSEVRYLLRVTRLDALFTIDPPGHDV